MNTAIILITIGCSLLLISCRKEAPESSSESLHQETDVGRVSYDEFVNGKQIELTDTEVLKMLGKPSMVNKTVHGEVWHYAPELGDLLQAKAKEIVGVTVDFNTLGEVIKISPIRKTIETEYNDMGTDKQ